MDEIISRDKLPKKPVPGLVICYSYLWYDEKQKKKVDGLKNRPCALILSHERIKQFPGKVIVDVAPITHQKYDDSVEIPLAVKHRMGLDDEHSWIVTTEVNRFIWQGPDVRPVRQVWQTGGTTWHWGFLPYDIFRKARDLVLAHRERETLHIIPRAGG